MSCPTFLITEVGLTKVTGVSQIHQMLIGHIHADIVYSHTGQGVTSYFRLAFIDVLKTAENAASDGFGSNFSDVAFCLPHQSVGFVFYLLLWSLSHRG